jgi:hypothetical protein
MTGMGSGVSCVRPQPAGTRHASTDTEPILAVVRPVPHCRAADAQKGSSEKSALVWAVCRAVMACCRSAVRTVCPMVAVSVSQAAQCSIVVFLYCWCHACSCYFWHNFKLCTHWAAGVLVPSFLQGAAAARQQWLAARVSRSTSTSCAAGMVCTPADAG